MGGLNNLVQRTFQRVHSSVTSGGSSSSRNVVAAAAAAAATDEERREHATAAAAATTAGESGAVAYKDDEETSTAGLKQQLEEEEEAKHQSILHSLYVQQTNNEHVLRGMPEGYVPPPPPPQVVPGQYWTVVPNDVDVLCGRGSKVNTHSGNISFRLLLGEWKELYISPHRRKVEKAHICAYLVDKIRATTGGHFLKRDDIKRVWVEIGDVQARKKVLQTLREDATELRAAKAKSKKNKAVYVANTTTATASTATTPGMPSIATAGGGGDGKQGTSISVINEQKPSPLEDPAGTTRKSSRAGSFPETLYCIERVYLLPEEIREQRRSTTSNPMSSIQAQEAPLAAAANVKESSRRLATATEDVNRTAQAPAAVANQGEVVVEEEEEKFSVGETHSLLDAVVANDEYSTLLQGSIQSFPISSCAGTSSANNSFHVTSSCTGFSSSNSGGGTNTNSGAHQSKTSLISVGGDVVKIDGVPLLKSFSPTLPKSPTNKAGSDSDNNGSSTSSSSKLLSNQAELPSLPMAAFHPPPPVILPEKVVTRPLSLKPMLPQTVVTTTRDEQPAPSSRTKGDVLRRSMTTSELTSSLRTAASSILRGGPSFVAENSKKSKSSRVPHFTYQYYHHHGGGNTTTGGVDDEYHQTSGVSSPRKPISSLAQEGHVQMMPYYPATGLLRLRNLFPRQRPPSLNESDSSTCTNLSDSILRESMESFDASNVDNLLDIGHWLEYDENEEATRQEQQQEHGTDTTTNRRDVIDLTGSNNTKSVLTTSDILEEQDDVDNDTAHEVLLATQAFEHAAGAGPRRLLRLTQSQRNEQRATLDQLLLDQDIVLDLDDYLSNTSQLLSSLTISVECVVIDSPPPSTPINE